jgi:hypothetical protein
MRNTASPIILTIRYTILKFHKVIDNMNPPKKGAMPLPTMVADVKVEILSPLLEV